MTLEEQIEAEVARQLEPVNAALRQMFFNFQQMKAAAGEEMIDPETGEPLQAPDLPLEGMPMPGADRPQAGARWGPGLVQQEERLNADLLQQMEQFTAAKARMQQAAAQNRMAEIEAQVAARMAVWQGTGGPK